ncbi:hypothetical protein FRC08_006824 [Ceratobasidium sp. 394]|nr:hypothetical protein FRC08_006824 [Ceratobasidium sp. 394]KAG9101275.1 hypothetical protein FS749_008499 [Ceratobasidium sp. UAMH 11750]
MPSSPMHTEDIVYMTFGYLSAPEVASLLTVNKLFFRNGIRYVWRNLRGTHRLLSVLADTPNQDGQFSIPDQIEEKTKERFEQYAACIHGFYTNTRTERIPPHWLGVEKLLSDAPIAPNVQVIKIGWDPVLDPSFNPLNTIRLFLGSSTTTLCLINWSNSQNHLTTDDVAQVLQRSFEMNSPLTELSLFIPPQDSSNPYSAFSTVFRQLHKLESLTLPKTWVNARLLELLWRFPRLRLLCFNDAVAPIPITVPQWGDLSLETDLDDEGFCALDELRLFQVALGDVQNLLSAHAVISQRITKLDLRIPGTYLNLPKNADLGAVFQLLVDTSPLLRDLTIEFPFCEKPFLIQSTTFSLLTQLDLERVQLGRVRIHSATDCSVLHNRWPRLTHFKMPSQPAAPADLVQFAARPTFQSLHVEVIVPPGSIEEAGDSFTSDTPYPTSIMLASPFCAPSVDDAWVRKFALFLLRCWPKVNLICPYDFTALPPSSAVIRDNAMYYGRLVQAVEAIRNGDA